MAKRFTDTNKYKKPFIRGLLGPYKLLWDYLYHECDHAGIWIVDFEIAQIYLGKDMLINKRDALKYFNSDEEKIIEINDGKKWFIPSFIEFQYGTLIESNRATLSVINILKKYNLLEKLNKGHISSLEGAKDKDKDKDKDKEAKISKKEEQTNQLPINKKPTKIKSKSFVPPTFDEVLEYFKINNYTVSAARRAYEHYELANWHDTNGHQVLNWKQKIHTNWFTEENKVGYINHKPNYNQKPPNTIGSRSTGKEISYTKEVGKC
jgi:hypothetical protein